MGMGLNISALLLKACTHMTIFAESALETVLESADSSPESADFTTDVVIVDCLYYTCFIFPHQSSLPT